MSPSYRSRASSPRGGEESPFHAGERAVQARLGVRERIERMGRNIVGAAMSAEQRAFFEDLPFLLVGSQAASGTIWASLLPGSPGFVQAPGARSLSVQTTLLPGDPLHGNVAVGAPLGVLGIELATRSRLRANGRVSRQLAHGFELGLDQCFGNCKQYIQARAGSFALPEVRLAPLAEGTRLSPEALELLERTDTSFIATASREPRLGGVEGVDVSHRGGRPGFIAAQDSGAATRLTLPDFYGNFMFNSFGNLEVNPQAGFLALDFASGAVLALTGRARVIWEGPAVAAFEGAERLLEFQVQAGLLWRGILTGWSRAEPSPHLRDTGIWSDVVARL